MTTPRITDEEFWVKAFFVLIEADRSNPGACADSCLEIFRSRFPKECQSTNTHAILKTDGKHTYCNQCGLELTPP